MAPFPSITLLPRKSRKPSRPRTPPSPGSFVSPARSPQVPPLPHTGKSNATFFPSQAQGYGTRERDLHPVRSIANSTRAPIASPEITLDLGTSSFTDSLSDWVVAGASSVEQSKLGDRVPQVDTSTESLSVPASAEGSSQSSHSQLSQSGHSPALKHGQATFNVPPSSSLQQQHVRTGSSTSAIRRAPPAPIKVPNNALHAPAIQVERTAEIDGSTEPVKQQSDSPTLAPPSVQPPSSAPNSSETPSTQDSSSGSAQSPSIVQDLLISPAFVLHAERVSLFPSSTVVRQDSATLPLQSPWVSRRSGERDRENERDSEREEERAKENGLLKANPFASSSHYQLAPKLRDIAQRLSDRLSPKPAPIRRSVSAQPSLQSTGAIDITHDISSKRISEVSENDGEAPSVLPRPSTERARRDVPSDVTAASPILPLLTRTRASSSPTPPSPRPSPNDAVTAQVLNSLMPEDMLTGGSSSSASSAVAPSPFISARPSPHSRHAATPSTAGTPGSAMTGKFIHPPRPPYTPDDLTRSRSAGELALPQPPASTGASSALKPLPRIPTPPRRPSLPDDSLSLSNPTSNGVSVPPPPSSVPENAPLPSASVFANTPQSAATRVRVQRKRSGTVPAKPGSSSGSMFPLPLSMRPPKPPRESAFPHTPQSYGGFTTEDTHREPQPNRGNRQQHPLPIGPRKAPLRQQTSLPRLENTSREEPFQSSATASNDRPSTANSYPPPHFPRLPTPKFQPVPVRWRGLTMDAAKWTFTSSQLQEIAGRAIRQSAEPTSIRLLPPEVLDNEIPTEVERLELVREEIKSKYKYQVRRRRLLTRSLALYIDGFDIPTATRLLEELTEATAACDQLSEDLFQVTDQLAQLAHLRDVHSGSALAMALRKLNTSFIRVTGEAVELRNQIATLQEEVQEGWSLAEAMERELEDLRARVQDSAHSSAVLSPASVKSSRRSSRVSAARKTSTRASKASLRSTSRSVRSSTSSLRYASMVFPKPPLASGVRAAFDDVPPVPPMPGVCNVARLAAGSPDFTASSRPNSIDALSMLLASPSSSAASRALVQAQNELLEMLGISPNDLNLRPRPRGRSYSDAQPPNAASPPVTPSEALLQPPSSPLPPRTLFRSASDAHVMRRRTDSIQGSHTSHVDQLYEGILEDPETLFAILTAPHP